VSLLDVHVNITFSAIAPYLDLEAVAGLPVSTKCPYCKANSWSIYQDNRNLEEWHYCSKCKVSGSIIAMAADLLDMSEVEALQYLSEVVGRPLAATSIQDYVKFQEQQLVYRKLWDISRNGLLCPSPEQVKLLKKKKWVPRTNMDSERILSGPGMLYGIVTGYELFSALKISHSTTSGLGRREDYIVIPYFKAPGRITGFYLTSQKRRVYWGSLRRFKKYKGDGLSGEHGFVGMQFVGQWQSSSVVVTSLMSAALQLQVRNFSSSLNPLPILAWRRPPSDATQLQWTGLAGRNLVLWEPEPTGAIVHQAVLSDAKLTFAGPHRVADKPRVGKYNQWLREKPALDIWRQVASSAKEPEDALRTWARSASPEQKVKLLADAEMCGQDAAKIVRRSVSAKVSLQVAKRALVPTRAIKGSHAATQHGLTSQRHSAVVLEKDYKWYSPDGKVRFPLIVRVTHVIVKPDGSQEFAGYIQNNKIKIDYHVPEKQATTAWARDFAIMQGMWAIGDTSKTSDDRIGESDIFKFNVFQVALSFHTPKLVKSISSVGWDGSGYQFKAAKLLNGQFFQNPEFKLPVDAPGPKVSQCRMRDEVKIALKRTGKEMEVVWALGLALCAQITAPQAGMPVYGIKVKRQRHDVFLAKLFTLFDLKKGKNKGWEHNWPRRVLSLKTVLSQDDTGFFVCRCVVTKEQTEDLIEVNIMEEKLQPRRITHSADKIVLNYLRHVSSLDLKPMESWNDWVNQTYDRMRQVFDFVDNDAITAAKERVKIL
jgi:hypothetical protein